MPEAPIAPDRRAFAAHVADTVRDARRLVGWTQRELAHRAGTSQATIWRIETGRADRLDLLVVERVLAALGIRATLGMDLRHLADRRRQLDAVHSRIVGHLSRRLARCGWLTATEVPLGRGAPRGWIDLLGFREADGALLVDETKTAIPDLGALGRSLAFYEREAPAAARALGWRPRCVAVLVTALDSVALAERLVLNRELVRQMFPEPVPDAAAWIADPRCRAPRGWAIGMVDPLSRSGTWLRPTAVVARRRTPAYADYADAAARLRMRSMDVVREPASRRRAPSGR